MKKLTAVFLALSLCACSPSPEEVGSAVKDLMQQKLQAQDLAEYHMTVDKVVLMHDSGNKYEGMATVVMDGQAHDVPVHVLADGKNVMFQTDPGAFMFTVQAQIKKSLAQFAKPDPTAISAPVQHLMDMEDTLNQKCRGGSGDLPTTTDACRDRDNVLALIKENGWCWGHKEDIGADRKWVRCEAAD